MRSFMTMLALMAAATTAFANDDVQDVRLRVQNLTRPDGKQTATLTGVTAPVAPAQSITVTVQIGATTATLTGKVSRRGRVRAVGRRLALATPLASFTQIEVDVTGGLVTALVMASADCVAAPNGRRLDCVETPAPPPPGDPADGAYDLSIDHMPAGTTDAANLTTNLDGTRTLRLWNSPLDFATLTMATDGALSGYYVFGGDAYVTVAGSATDESTSVLSRLTGTFSGAPIGTRDFAMERGADGTPSTLGGTWHLTFVGGGFQPFSGTALLDVTVPATGLATAAPTTLVRTGGMTAYTTGAGTCTVAPAGGLYCMLPRTVGGGAVFLHGMLDADSGQGTFAIGAAPAIDSTGSWTATR